VRQTRTKRIGVIGTEATIASRAYEVEIKRLDPSVMVLSKSCPLFVPLVESGWINGPICTQIAGTYLEPLNRQRIDTLILGCTHYPLLASVLRKAVGSRVSLIDSATETAAEVKGVLAGSDSLSTARTSPRHRFFVTDEPDHFTTLGERFLGCPIRSVDRVNH
jgi:glutamate racemase